jgi:hypothetical protein
MSMSRSAPDAAGFLTIDRAQLHVFVSHPKEIAAVIESAARDAAARTQP